MKEHTQDEILEELRTYFADDKWTTEEIENAIKKALKQARKDAYKEGQRNVNSLRIHNLQEAVIQIEDRAKADERRKVEEEMLAFILNILDGIDIADEEIGNTGGGTKAIRFALESRTFLTKALTTKEDNK